LCREEDRAVNTRLIEKLKERYETPQALLAALGLDAKDLGVDIVGDGAIKSKGAHMSAKTTVLSRKGAMVMGAVHHFLYGGEKPRLAADAKIDWAKLIGPVTAKNFSQKKGIIVAGVKEQTRGKLAKDASVEGLVELLEGLEKVEAGDAPPAALATEPNGGVPKKEEPGEEDMPMDADVHAGLRAFLEEKGMSPEDIEAACATVGDAELQGEATLPGKLGTLAAAKEGEDEEDDDEMMIPGKKGAKDRRGARDEPPPFKGRPEVGGGAMSKDEVNKTVQAAVRAERDRASATREAEREVRPWVGDMAMAHDSAADVYRTALTALGVDIEDVPVSVPAYRAIMKQIPQPGGRAPARAHDAAMAEDSTEATDDFAKAYPTAARIKHA
jgi:uncharacterized protein